MRKLKVLISIITIVCLFQFCTKDNTAKDGTQTEPNLPVAPYSYIVNFPNHVNTELAATDNTPANNKLTNEGATLGRVLFYDKNLSANNTISCASCHKQELSFDDHEILSTGFNGGKTDRNSMSLLNLRFYKSGKMFWDERSVSLEAQVLQPIQNHVEMGLTLNELEARVKGLSYYPNLFLEAFGSTAIDTINISKALSQYVRSLVTYQSKYDLVKEGKSSFSVSEARGEQIFLNAAGFGGQTCGSCHTPPMFITSNPGAGFGLVDNNDTGINGSNRFKSSSLRNIMNRTSLFHNGSITNVQAMLTAGAPGSNTRPIPQHSIAPQDVQDMISFLNTLTDETIYKDPKFSDPFK
jgi:cytochrome c peroxidase